MAWSGILVLCRTSYSMVGYVMICYGMVWYDGVGWWCALVTGGGSGLRTSNRLHMSCRMHFAGLHKLIFFYYLCFSFEIFYEAALLFTL